MDQLQDGMLLLIVGMSTVFFFLTVMVACVFFTSLIARRFDYLLPETGVSESPSREADGESQSGDKDALAVVVSAAIHAFRSGK